MTSKATHIRNSDGLKPELGITPGVSHMDMRWLPSLHAEEEESVPSDPQQRWHEISLTQFRL